MSSKVGISGLKRLEEENKIHDVTRKAHQQKVVYIGASIPGMVQSNTVYNNGVPEELVKLGMERPAVKNLIVPVEKLAAAKKEIGIVNSALRICFDTVKDYVRKGEIGNGL